MSWLGATNRSYNPLGSSVSGIMAYTELFDTPIGVGGSPGGATQVFNFTSFPSNPTNLNQNGTQPSSVTFDGTTMAIVNGVGGHQSQGVWYNVAQQNIQSFTTSFTFQMQSVSSANVPSIFNGQMSGTTLTVNSISFGTLKVGTLVADPGIGNVPAGTTITALGTGTGGTGTYTVNQSATFGAESMTGGASAGFGFVVQNSTSTTQPVTGNGSGNRFQGDANFAGYGALAHLGANQGPCLNSVGLMFDCYMTEGFTFPGAGPNGFALFVNGGPDGDMNLKQDPSAAGIFFQNGNVFSCNIVYDGTILTMTLLDTTTNAQVRYSWPINIPACTQQNTAWIGFSGGALVPVPWKILTWKYSTGYNTRLAAPTFNVAAGSYTGTQTVTIIGPSGASIYYSTDGLQPTTSDNLCSGPVTISDNTFLQAVAVQSGFTDSVVTSANYQIQASGSLIINFPSGFASSSNLIVPVGYARLSGSSYKLTDSLVNGGESGGIWYAAPVPVSSFTTNFTLQFTDASQYGMAFVLQNQNQSASTGYVSAAPGSAPSAGYGTGQLAVTGGPLSIGKVGQGMGFGASQTPNTNVYGNGYIGLYNSVAVVFNVTGGSFTGVYLNGAFPSGSNVTVTGVNLASGNPITCALTYSGATLSMSLHDTVAGTNFSYNFTVDIPTTVGSSAAYAGFTGGTLYAGVNQFVSAWTM